MFGYIRTDTPHLYIKDDILYRAMYCGVCKGIASVCGQSARFGLSYDLTFLSVILHNIKGIDVKIEKQHCLTHCIRSRQMAEVDELTRQIGALNTLLSYYKCIDDISDGDGGKAKRLLFKKGFKRAKKQYPEIEKIVRKNLQEQQKRERAKTDNLDLASDATATIMAQFSDYVLQDSATEYTRNLFYAVGKWIYLIDALDDYDKDKKKGAYNPFIAQYGAPCREKLVKSDLGEEVRYVFRSLFFDIRENLAQIKFHFNRDLSDNILLLGLPKTTENVINGLSCSGRCKRGKTDDSLNQDKNPHTTDNK